MPTALTDQGLRDVPNEPKAPNTFSNGHAQDNDGFDWGVGTIPDLYQPRDMDIPFGRMYHGYCMQDVCISFWPEGETPETSAFPDMIAKVTDICSTDPNDPTHCATPSDIKLDRAKVQVMYSIPSPGKENADLQKPVYPRGTFWHLTKCWTNGLPQPAYQDNWWGQPPLPNNFMWSVDATRQQWKNNQKSYPSKGWDTYQNGMEIPSKEAIAAITPPSDWVPGQEPKWAPIAGGKGFGTPERSNGPPPAMWPGKTAKAEGKVEGKAVVKAVVKAEVKGVAKVRPKVEVKAEVKAEVKEAVKEADKAEVKAEVNPETRAEAQ
ncbi:MAG: hypothetical protein Q9173_005401 [Seirophora scorigena]